MNTLDKEHVRCVVNTIFSQLLHTTPIDVINSWGISKMHATPSCQEGQWRRLHHGGTCYASEWISISRHVIYCFG